MEKNSLLTFFEVVSNKIKYYVLLKNTISRLGFLLFSNKNNIHSVETSSKKKQRTLQFFTELNKAKWSEGLSHSFKISLMTVIFFVSSKSSGQSWVPIAPVNIPSGGFNIDGTLKANSAVGDWVDGTGAGGFVLNESSGVWGPINASTTTFIRDDFNATSDRIFTGSAFGDNPNTWKWTTGKATSKCDINTALFHSATSSTQKWLVLGGDRFTTVGTSYIDFEFSQGKFTRKTDGTFSFSSVGPNDENLAGTNGRMVGDFVLSMEYSNGGTNATVHYYRWEQSGSTYKYVEKPIPSPDGVPSAYGATNGTPADVPYSAFNTSSYISYAFVEAAVNIDAILSANCQQIAIKTVFVKTKASDAYTAALKDFVDPQPVNFIFGNAGLSYGGNNFCKTGTLTPTVPAVPNGTFSYTAIPLGSILSLNTSSGLINLSTSDVGSYTVTYTPSGGACLIPATANVSIVANPTALTLTGTSICISAGNVGTISSVTSAIGVNYQLYDSLNATVQTAKSGSGAALQWAGLAAGSGYYVIGTGSTPTSCTSTSNAVNVTAVSNPTALELTGSSICTSAGNVGTISSTTSGNNTVSYQLYDSSNAPVQVAKAGTGLALSWTGLAAGNGYYVKATGATPTSCIATSNTVNVTAVTNPTALSLTGTSICTSAGDVGTISSTTSGNNTISYQLYNSSNAPVQGAKAGTGLALSWTGLAAGNGYYVKATGATPTSCLATSNTVNVTAVTNPTAPTFCMVQPSLCSTTAGSVTINSPCGAGYQYSIDDGETWQTETVFSGLTPGSVTGIRVKKGDCVSAAASCAASDCVATPCPSTAGKIANTDTKTTAIGAPIEAKTTTVGFDAYPVPFKDQLTIKYKFDYITDVKIEVFNAQGISVLSKTDTNSYLNKEIALDLKFNRGKEQLYLVKVTTNRGSTTKKIMSSK